MNRGVMRLPTILRVSSSRRAGLLPHPGSTPESASPLGAISARLWRKTRCEAIAVMAYAITTCVLPAAAAAAPGITEFSAGISHGSSPRGIVAGPDGSLWFTQPSGDRVGRITPAGLVTEFSTGISPGSYPRGIAVGPDGNLWFTESVGNRVGRITTAGTVTEFSTGISPGSYPKHIAAGPDGNLWFTESIGNRVARITPTGVVTEFSTGISAGSYLDGIAAGPDGNLWFTEQGGNRIGRITPKGEVTEFSTGLTSGSGPSGITAGPDGNLWFTQVHGGRIGRITPEGKVTEFSPGIGPGSYPSAIAAGPDGNLWFTQARADRVARITPAGVVTSFSAGLNPGAAPDGITAGPDGNLWFTEPSGDRIGRVADLPPVGGTGATRDISPFGATVTGTVDARTVPTAVRFQYGTSNAYGMSTPEQDAGADSSAVAILAQVAGLAAGTVYHYRLVARNASGFGVGDDRTFTTLPSPALSVTKAGFPPPFRSSPPSAFPPTLRGLSLSPRAFTAATDSSRTKQRTGATVRYRLDRMASVSFSVERVLAGRQDRRSCVAPSRRLRRQRRCTRYVSVRGGFTHLGRIGANHLRFTGRLAGQRLTPGSYRVTARPTAGPVSGSKVRVSFRVKR